MSAAAAVVRSAVRAKAAIPAAHPCTYIATWRRPCFAAVAFTVKALFYGESVVLSLINQQQPPSVISAYLGG